MLARRLGGRCIGDELLALLCSRYFFLVRCLLLFGRQLVPCGVRQVAVRLFALDGRFAVRGVPVLVAPRLERLLCLGALVLVPAAPPLARRTHQSKRLRRPFVLGRLVAPSARPLGANWHPSNGPIFLPTPCDPMKKRLIPKLLSRMGPNL